MAEAENASQRGLGGGPLVPNPFLSSVQLILERERPKQDNDPLLPSLPPSSTGM
jgi:hypothetical protein